MKLGLSKGHLPYRGEPQPKFPKRHRQLRNLKRERQELNRTVFIIILIVLFLGGFAIFLFLHGKTEFLPIFLIVLSFVLPLLLAIINGLVSINKFRKGYDIDISGASKDEEPKQPEDVVNH